MFNRVDYKKLAKKNLKGRYRTAILATLITIFISALVSSGTNVTQPNVRNNSSSHLVSYTTSNYYSFEKEFNISNNLNASSGVSYLALIFTLLSIAIEGVLIMALCYLFNQYYIIPEEKIEFAEYLRGFNLWWSGARAALWYSLWVFLWSLLFVIPGIVKSISYSQMFFIIAENPKISVTKAMRISKILTKDFKADIFIMQLSFLGWELLTVLTLGILQAWLIPYQMMSFTNAYKDLKNYALRNGRLTLEDFN